jgi:hypothetical protein
MRRSRGQSHEGREFIAFNGSTVAAWALAARAQQPDTRH